MTQEYLFQKGLFRNYTCSKMGIPLSKNADRAFLERGTEEVRIFNPDLDFANALENCYNGEVLARLHNATQNKKQDEPSFYL